jgi:hypothetical protein
MNKIRMRSDLAEEGMSVPAGKSFEDYDTLVDVIYLSADDLVDAVQGSDPADGDDHPFCYVKLRNGECYYMISADLDFPVKMKVSERFALEQWLSDYPDTMSYASVLQVIGLDSFCSGDNGIFLWEMIENYPNDDIIDIIENTRSSFEDSANDLVYGVALHDVMEGACDDYE